MNVCVVACVYTRTHICADIGQPLSLSLNILSLSVAMQCLFYLLIATELKYETYLHILYYISYVISDFYYVLLHHY